MLSLCHVIHYLNCCNLFFFSILSCQTWQRLLIQEKAFFSFSFFFFFFSLFLFWSDSGLGFLRMRSFIWLPLKNGSSIFRARRNLRPSNPKALLQGGGVPISNNGDFLYDQPAQCPKGFRFSVKNWKPLELEGVANINPSC